MFLRTLVVGIAVSASAFAGLISIGGFSGSETVINFNGIGDTQPITTQYLGSGITFSGAQGFTNSGDTQFFPGNGGGVIALNTNFFDDSAPPIAASFTSPVNRAGFLHETNTADALLVRLFLGATQTGSFLIPNPNGLTVDFFGVEDLGGFDRIEIDAQNNLNGFLAIDDFRFEAVASAVPEPSSFVLLSLGIAGLTLLHRRLYR